MVKKSIVASLVFLFTLGQCLFAEGLEKLVDKTAQSILDFFKDKHDNRVSVVKFENFSGYSDIAAQKYYQLLAARLEASGQVAFSDLMINFSGNRGEFNLNRIDQLDWFITIKLIRKRDKLGAGTAIFSRTLDKIVSLKYFEEPIGPGEREILNTLDFGFKGSGFSKVTEIEARRDLLACTTIAHPQGQERHYFFYPDELEIYTMGGARFKKFFSFKLEWKRPYYPVMQPEGRIAYFYRDQVLYLTLGGNFSPISKVFSYEENRWTEIEGVPFVPFRLIRINQDLYLAGARYEAGKNYFEGKILLSPLQSSRLVEEKLYTKSVPPFYSLAFAASGDGNDLESIHLVDRDYNYRFLAADFEERTAEEEKRGSALSALNGLWLAVSGYSTRHDKLYFYKIEGGGRQLVFENELQGEIVFISDGAWESRPGFWVYLRRGEQSESSTFHLQFWSKKDG